MHILKCCESSFRCLVCKFMIFFILIQTLAHTLQGLGQDEGMYQQYIPLALHLAEESFLCHQSRDVQLLIACCIADVLRVYAPEAPYKEQEQVKVCFMSIIIYIFEDFDSHGRFFLFFRLYFYFWSSNFPVCAIQRTQLSKDTFTCWRISHMSSLSICVLSLKTVKRFFVLYFR